MLIFRIPYVCFSTPVLQGTIYASLLLHPVQDIKIQLSTTNVDVVLYTSTSCIYSMKMTPLGIKTC